MDETSTATLEHPTVWYQPTERERELIRNEAGRLQHIKGSPRVWYVEVEGVGPAIFKLHRYSDTQNERAAYLVSEIVGFNFVPTTVLRKIGGEKGSLQEFIEDAVTGDELESTDEIQDDLYKFWLFRHILRNPDGDDYNFLVQNGKLISIDHDASFDSDTPDPSYYDAFRNYYGQEASTELIAMFRSYLGDDVRQETLRVSLKVLLDDKDVEITMKILQNIGNLIVENGRIQSKEDLKI